jgi:heterodisulfide reductase subunit B
VKFALFVGCAIPAEVPAYERSARAVLRRLGVGLVDLDFGCCGDPVRRLRLDAHLVLAARNLALAAARGLDVLTLCQCCYGSLRHAQHLLRGHPELQARCAEELAREGLALPDHAAAGHAPRPAVRHLLDVLARDVGLDAIAARVTAPQTELAAAAHYGCRALRPSDVVDLDNPHAPTVFERLVAVTGARSVDWPRRLDCCGAPLAEQNPELAARLRAAKLADAREAGAAALCTACPHCQTHFAAAPASGLDVLLYPQVLGLALGLSRSALGLPQTK